MHVTTDQMIIGLTAGGLAHALSDEIFSVYLNSSFPNNTQFKHEKCRVKLDRHDSQTQGQPHNSDNKKASRNTTEGTSRLR